jgi:death on curing protein
VKYLTAQEILILHDRVLGATEGSDGIRDVHLLASLVERPKTSIGGKEMFPNIFEKAAVYLESLAKYHVFIDGNKRTCITASARFLFINGFELTANDKEVVQFVLQVATEKLEIQEIAGWLKTHSKKYK